MLTERQLAESAYGLACGLPGSVLESVAQAVLTTPVAMLRAEISKRVPQHHHRDLVLKFLEQWRVEGSHLSAQAVAVALQTAAISVQAHRESQSVELVWTGPDAGVTTFRRTEQAILQLLDAARERITLVSFAVYSIPNVARSLVQAARRGVRLTVIIETPDKLGGEHEYSTIRALGDEVAACATLYYWPKEHRAVSDSNKPGLLHVKCAVADGEWLFLSSANLTQQAFTINMELGMLIRGGAMARKVEQQFSELIQFGQLQPL
ncbi:MAG: DISARM system phospholipase D-like protein DrmC [Planctomyces sp.]|jgi:phosphatidylserine/phosphatidylglycerophosphate/cardiolipin synthase-like enzyme